ncbi:MAG: cation diffusion facilitator family transporter [Candidatus Izemoplasmataceae bacterium]
MKAKAIMYRSFFVNLVLIGVKLLSGFIFSSVALIADAVHSTSDLLTDVFVIFGVQHSLKPADDDHPFGHGKFEYVLSFIMGLFIISIAYNLAKFVISSFNEVSEIPNALSLIVVVFVVIVKTFLVRYMIKEGKNIQNDVVLASGKESMTDVLSSAVVFVGIASVLIGDYFELDFLKKGDKIASIFIALFIAKVGIEVLIDSIKSLQGKAVSKEISNRYLSIAEKITGVEKVDKLYMIHYGPFYQAAIDIRVDGNITVEEGHEIATRVSETLYQDEKICHVIVHVNPEVEDDERHAKKK